MDVVPDIDGVAGESVVVIGGGFGGLSTACYLADAGADVTLLEKNEQLGGRASRLEVDGFQFDMGPSWYLMPDVFERFFGHFGRSPDEFYELERLDPHYRVFWKDGDQVDVLPDRDANREIFESYEPGAGEAFDAYLEESKRTYEIGMEHFVYEDRPRLRDYVDTDVMRYSWGLSLLGKMQGHVEDYFDHPKLQQLMQYTLVFLGGSPTNTPALYNLMSHVDYNMGVYYPDGGIGAVVDGIVELAEDLGVDFVTDAEVTGIEGRYGAFAVDTENGERYLADRVVSDADYAHTEQELLPERKRQYTEEYWESRTYAPSAFLLYLGVEGDVPNLEHHTLVLPTDWDEHFEQIFDDPEWPDDPAYYLCVPSKTDDTVAPEGHSNLFALVPIAPGIRDTPEIRNRYRDLVIDDIAENTGTDLRGRVVVEETFSVDDFADRYNSYAGSALGLAHTLTQTSLLRPGHTSDAVDGLYFTGSTTTPGIGVPMCLISGGLTAEAMADDDV
ncbi:phytoene desaturase family protein [Halorubrum ezzemoulense]|uniref:Phytoene dehydrogenase n=1 Tax=Halorubrum ezzemoulense DSM 17463 TaxID=1121945 RepID=A0A1X4GLM3_HALEZ|nr:phytoene desaturase family protein [Halorubrum ezzemoulense]MDB2223386.1 phytoene desaturase family protein [Halorubrum ezzemoulense]MDB2237649.1 phytoene desaturase family protein [Halorubrum ezzemoulense]MDB2248857.1 phytoene desaturase family protein [Halorubrum ezzemoulense]MDB9249736.1 phytoene desaturase family protein [Halorubrum ezzemoulense]MDB9259907.1 phytoene desaturase family protein [Halorubrum ezzemoulense]